MEQNNNGVGLDPHSHLNKALHPMDQDVKDPKHAVNRHPAGYSSFTRTAAIHDGTRNPAVHSNINIPDRFELFILGDGEKKITEAPDTRTPNSSVFTVAKEDHTLGNLLRAHLLKDPHVMFAGYKVPHPLFATFELRVQTDGEITPKEALTACCKGIVSDLGQLSREFTKEFELRKMVGGEGSGNVADK